MRSPEWFAASYQPGKWVINIGVIHMRIVDAHIQKFNNLLTVGDRIKVANCADSSNC